MWTSELQSGQLIDVLPRLIGLLKVAGTTGRLHSVPDVHGRTPSGARGLRGQRRAAASEDRETDGRRTS